MVGEAIVTVGDAAGLANPCSSGGIHPALHSGRVAAETIIKAHGSHDPFDLSAYEREMRSSPICSPLVTEAREYLDGLTDDQWNWVVAALKARDEGRLKGLDSISRFLLDSPFAVTHVWKFKALGKAFDTYTTWGW
jgi:flavin-dependent dehydrogenase